MVWAIVVRSLARRRLYHLPLTYSFLKQASQPKHAPIGVYHLLHNKPPSCSWVGKHLTWISKHSEAVLIFVLGAAGVV